MIGNGHACTLPESELTEEVKQAWNLIRIGETADEIMPDGSNERCGHYPEWCSHCQCRFALRSAEGDRYQRVG